MDQRLLIYSGTIHGTGIFTYIWLIFMANVGKYTSTSPMDPGRYSFLHVFFQVFEATKHGEIFFGEHLAWYFGTISQQAANSVRFFV